MKRSIPDIRLWGLLMLQLSCTSSDMYEGFIHQPDDGKVPGINSWFSIEYNRHNTWFEHSGSWIDYQRRCCYMLQQGRHHADVYFFISEESPRMSGWTDEQISKGYIRELLYCIQ